MKQLTEDQLLHLSLLEIGDTLQIEGVNFLCKEYDSCFTCSLNSRNTRCAIDSLGPQKMGNNHCPCNLGTVRKSFTDNFVL